MSYEEIMNQLKETSEILKYQQYYLLAKYIYYEFMINCNEYGYEYMGDVEEEINKYIFQILNDTGKEVDILNMINSSILGYIDPLEFLFSPEYELYIGILKRIRQSISYRNTFMAENFKKITAILLTNSVNDNNYKVYNYGEFIDNKEYNDYLRIIKK